MSKLMGLFSSSESDGNDSLRYSAPKEPKRKPVATKSREIASSASEDIVQQKTAMPASVNPPSAQSKVLASASVRLFRMNTSTQAHEPIENGSMLGCVIMGSNGLYQLLIYNGQKIPQALVVLSATFDYVVQDLYLSFYDANGNYFSVLFDSISTMSDLVRMISGCIVHSLSFASDEEVSSLTRSLPKVNQAQSDDIVLSNGMSAGLHISVWEMDKSFSYPADIFAKVPLKSVSGEDLVKFKLLNSDSSIIANMIDSLVGRRKGDRFILGLSPSLVARSTWIGTSKQSDKSWFFFECEIVKVKTSVNVENKTTEEQSVTDGHDGDVTARIARIAAKAGNGGAHLAKILKPKEKQNQAFVESETSVAVESDRGTSVPTDRIVESKEHTDSAVVNNFVTPAAVTTVVVRQDTKVPDATSPFPSEESLTKSVNAAVVESAYQKESITASARDGREPLVASTSQNLVQSPQFIGHSNDIAFNTNFHQSMMIIQQSIMQLHTKMDQVSMQVTSCHQLQQKMDQQAFNSQNMSFPQYGLQSNLLGSTFPGYPVNQFASPNFMFSNPYLSMNSKFPGGGPLNYTPLHLVQRKEEILQKFQSFIDLFDQICVENNEVRAKLESNSIKEHSHSNDAENKRLSFEIEGLEKKLSSASAELSNLKHEFENLEESKVVQAFVSQKLIEERNIFDAQLNSTLRENETLKQQLAELRAKHELLHNEYNSNKLLLEESSSQVGLKMEEIRNLHAKLAEVENGQKGYNNDQLNEILRNIFLRSSEHFVTAEDLAEIEDENLQTLIRKTSKSNLKRLRDILSEISEQTQ